MHTQKTTKTKSNLNMKQSESDSFIIQVRFDKGGFLMQNGFGTKPGLKFCTVLWNKARAKILHGAFPQAPVHDFTLSIIITKVLEKLKTAQTLLVTVPGR